MKIRSAGHKDLPGITRCARDFFVYAKYTEQGMPLNENDFQAMVGKYIDDGVVLLMDDGQIRGGIAGMMNDWGFNNSIKVMVELFYWVDPECRGVSSLKLLKAFERASKSLGADKIFMVSVGTDIQDQVGNLYKRMGYKEHERFYIKGDLL